MIWCTQLLQITGSDPTSFYQSFRIQKVFLVKVFDHKNALARKR